MTQPGQVAALAGLRVVVTRAAHQAGDLTQQLEGLGADVVELPTIELERLSPAPLDDALGRLATFDWIALTSANGVDILVDRMGVAGVTIARGSPPLVAAIGAATAGRLEAGGITVDLVSEQAVAESLLAALVARGVAGKHVLLPVASGARAVLPDGLRATGAEVEIVETYRSRVPVGFATETSGTVLGGAVDLWTFASPSAVRHTAEMIGGPVVARAAVACIGPVTSAAARKLGMRVDVEAAEHSIRGLIDAIVAWNATRTS